MATLFRAILHRIAMLLAILIAGLLALAWLGKADAHDAYTHWKNKVGQSCCEGQHCHVYPAEKVRETPRGWHLENGADVPWNDALPSPDNDYHLCTWPGLYPPCFAVPGSG